MKQGDSDLIAFGQLGSTFTSDATQTILPPSGRYIIAVTFLEDLTLDRLVAAGTAYLDSSFNTSDGGAAKSPTNGSLIASTVTFPKGVTIYGKWKEVSLAADAASNGGIICYFG